MRTLIRIALILSLVPVVAAQPQDARKPTDAEARAAQAAREHAEFLGMFLPKPPEGRPSMPTDPPRRPGGGVVANVADGGTNGDVFMTSPAPFTSTGVLLQAKASWPFIVAKTGSSDVWSAFTVNNSSNVELFRVNSAG